MSLRTPPFTALNTYKLEVTGSPVANLSVVLAKISVQSSYASAVWLLAFSAASEPANGAVPIAAPMRIAATATNVESSFPGGLLINGPGLVLIASSTAGTLTKDTSATLYITAYIEEYEKQPTLPNSTTGDLTTAVSSKQVWADSAGPKKLRRLQIKNNVASIRYAVVYARDTPNSTSRIVAWRKIAASTNVDWDFGEDGLAPYEKGSDLTEYDGCTVYCQADLVPANQVGVSTDLNILATYF